MNSDGTEFKEGSLLRIQMHLEAVSSAGFSVKHTSEKGNGEGLAGAPGSRGSETDGSCQLRETRSGTMRTVTSMLSKQKNCPILKVNNGPSLFRAFCKRFGVREQGQLHDPVNIRKTTELYTLK